MADGAEVISGYSSSTGVVAAAEVVDATGAVVADGAVTEEDTGAGAAAPPE